MTQRRRDQAPLPVLASRLAAAWAFLYGLYRGYYAVWITSAVPATIALTVVGLLSAFGVIGDVIVG